MSHRKTLKTILVGLSSAAMLLTTMFGLVFLSPSTKADTVNGAQSGVEQFQVPLSYDYKIFTPYAGGGQQAVNETADGMGENHETFCSCADCLKSLNVNFAGVDFKFADTARSGGNTADKDALKMDGKVVDLTAYASQLAGATSLNMLAVAWNGDIHGSVYTVTYTDGSTQDYTAPEIQVFGATDDRVQQVGFFFRMLNIGRSDDHRGHHDDHSRGIGGLAAFLQISLDPSKTVESVQFPNLSNPTGAVLCMTAVRPSYTYPAGVAGYQYIPVDLTNHFKYSFLRATDTGSAGFPGTPDGSRVYNVQKNEEGAWALQSSPVSGGLITAPSGVPFQLGPYENGAKNAVANDDDGAPWKVIPFDPADAGEMRSVHVLLTTGSGPQVDWFKLNYADGSSSYHNYFSRDRFCQSGDATMAAPNVAARAYKNDPGSNEFNTFYDITLTPAAGKKVTSIELPPHGNFVYLAVTLDRIVKTSELSSNRDEQIPVDLSADFNYKLFSMPANMKTNDGIGSWHQTLPGEDAGLANGNIAYNGIGYKLSPNITATDMTKYDSLRCEGQYLTLKGGARVNATSINFLMCVWDSPKKDLKFTVVYTDGTTDAYTQPYLSRSADTPTDPLAAYITPYAHHSYYEYNDQGQKTLKESNHHEEKMNIVAVSVPVNSAKQLSRIKLPEINRIVYSDWDNGVIQMSEGNMVTSKDHNGAILAMTITSPVNRYAESDPQLRGYLAKPINLNDLMNADAIFSAHNDSAGSWLGDGGICGEHLSTVKYENGIAVADQALGAKTDFTVGGIPFNLAPSNNQGANKRTLNLSDGVSIPFGMESGAYRSIHMITAACGGIQPGRVTLAYEDGSTSTHAFFNYDWTMSAGGGFKGIAQLDIRRAPNVALISDKAKSTDKIQMYDITVIPDAGKKVTGLQVYNYAGQLLALSVETPVYGPAYTSEDPGNPAPAADIDREYVFSKLDLTDHFNMDAFSDADHMEDGDMDGVQNTIPCDASTGIAQEMAFRGVPFRFGSFELGELNAIYAKYENIEIPVKAGKYEQIGVLFSKTGGDYNNFQFEIVFSDGTTQVCDLGYVKDWTSAGKNSPVLSRLIHDPQFRYGPVTAGGFDYVKQVNSNACIFAGNVYIDYANLGKDLVKIRLLQNEQQKFFAFTLGGYKAEDPGEPQPVDISKALTIDTGVLDIRYDLQAGTITLPRAGLTVAEVLAAMNVKEGYEIKFFNGSAEITDDSTSLLQGMLFRVYDKESGEYAELAIRITHTQPDPEDPDPENPDPEDPVDTGFSSPVLLLIAISCVSAAAAAFVFFFKKRRTA